VGDLVINGVVSSILLVESCLTTQYECIAVNYACAIKYTEHFKILEIWGLEL